ncbi:MAG: UDP-2,4-diacetamido-2,4,6-trideoxy-beta-L-altropyranose hydrolase [Burkholderiales bacterium]|nr:UDP-2,4-diacetamido-2,4,6-trideoxy-beta-L-altropyranose hydrolase [Burkholderiales bacterium]MDE2453298.1 UDP-2,4-diacetamido-2,4,6-trideoxy-beta-L-altropyranose hydrolase [Burkholderiales bacterium]
MKVFIRTDASSATGLGHLRRCLSLAQALRQLGAEVRLGVGASDVDAAALAAAEGFAARTLAPVPGGGADDAARFCALWPAQRPDWVVVDHYGLDATWQRAVRQAWHCQVAAVDDLADRPLAVDALIDPNFVADSGHRARYAAVLEQAPAAWLCGPRFALLGPAYAAAKAFRLAPAVRSIGIFLGGTDPAGLSPVVLRACREVARFDGPVEIATSSGNPGLAALRAAVASDPGASLAVDLPDLAGFFARHDLQVGAGGGAAWERCCIGAPALTLCIAANQLAVIPALVALGATATATDNSALAIGTALAGLIASPQRRAELSRQGRALVDGRGAERVALALAARVPAGLGLRPATRADARLLWLWRNDPATRAVSRRGLEIAPGEHERWLADTLADPARVLAIGAVGARDVGVIRFDRLGDDAHEVSLYLDPALHGLGLGSALLQAGEAALIARNGRAEVRAEVLPGNPASRRLFAGAGYSTEDGLHFSKRLAAAAGLALAPVAPFAPTGRAAGEKSA